MQIIIPIAVPDLLNGCSASNINENLVAIIKPTINNPNPKIFVNINYNLIFF